MALLIFVITVVFACIAFFSNQPQTVTGNSFYTYYVYIIRYGIQHWGWFGTGLVFLILAYYRQYKKWRPAVIQAVQVGFLGLLLSAVLIFAVGVVELNVLAMIFNKNPGSLGVETNAKVITDDLKAFDYPPQVIASDTDQKIGLFSIAQALAGKTNYYGNFIIPAVPKWLVLPVKKPESSLMLVDRNLIVTQLKAEDIQEISPVIANLIVKDYFSNRQIKAFPTLLIMDQTQYQEYRRGDFAQKLKDIEELMKQTTEDISSFSAQVKEAQDNVTAGQELIQKTYEKQDQDYQKCLSAGNYVKGIFVRTNSEEACDDQRQSLNQTVVDANAVVDRWNKEVSEKQKLLDEYKVYKDFLESQNKVGEALINNIPHELGAFDPPDTIRLTLESTSSHAVADYFETLVHEYLHYASHISEEKKFSDNFFEESLTEYFARKAIEKDMNVETNLGYPAAEKIVGQMTKRIPESDLANIYFTKDQTGMERLLDRVYGDGFYENNSILFNSLMYAANQKQLLLLANMLMDKIGGEQLTEKDIMSTFSEVN